MNEQMSDEPFRPDFESANVDEIAKEIYNEGNLELVERVEGMPPFLVEMLVKSEITEELYRALERLLILAARAGVGSLLGGSRYKEKAEGSFGGHLVFCLPKSVIERNNLTWEEVDAAFGNVIHDFESWLDKHLSNPEEQEG